MYLAISLASSISNVNLTSTAVLRSISEFNRLYSTVLTLCDTLSKPKVPLVAGEQVYVREHARAYSVVDVKEDTSKVRNGDETQTVSSSFLKRLLPRP